ncbi:MULTISPECIES: hypothetical protein [unclassified Achromobacter]|uniref:hypothetical protein n=1 Tax=unclassified Achromobacter TaxID=2626865 RepID=UPI000B51DAF8|nr:MULTISPECIES: hypothetical protein [unclassified Achromobacter]OWT69113.1 hypothetical protein CEY05_28150 [Achromobacter sp. HZ34]OWT70518.1 hypothetical protein CEY04_26980 [Achromobacter sp. HZ28]
MALDDATSAAPGRTPSLLAGRSDAGARDSQSSRILAALEGRAPQAERQHMPAAKKRSSRAWWLLLLILLLIGAGGGAAWWRIQQKARATEMPSGTVIANGNAGGAGQAGAANAAAGNGAGSAGSSSSGAALPASAPGASAAPAASASGNVDKSAAEAAPPATASIVDAPGSNRDANSIAAADARRAEDDKPPSNPLSALAAAPAVPPQQAALAEHKPADGKGAAAKSEGKAAARNSHTAKAKKKPDGDAALLSALMSYGLPPPTSATATAALPGAPLAERLQQCRRKPFLESEQCRLQVCAGQWGLAPECPNPQAQTQTPKRP